MAAILLAAVREGKGDDGSLWAHVDAPEPFGRGCVRVHKGRDVALNPNRIVWRAATVSFSAHARVVPEVAHYVAIVGLAVAHAAALDARFPAGSDVAPDA